MENDQDQRKKEVDLYEKILNKILKIEEYKIYKELISKEYKKLKENLYKQESTTSFILGAGCKKG